MMVRTLRDPFLVGNKECIGSPAPHAEAEPIKVDWLFLVSFFGGGTPRSDSVAASLVTKRQTKKFWGIELVRELRHMECFGMPKTVGGCTTIEAICACASVSAMTRAPCPPSPAICVAIKAHAKRLRLQ